MKVKIIKTDRELDAALARLETLAQCTSRTEEETDELELLSLVIADYENRNYPLSFASPVDTIRYVMAHRQLRVRDIAFCFGSTARAYAVLSGSRNLSLNMIRRLHKHLQIPAECLIGPSEKRS